MAEAEADATLRVLVLGAPKSGKTYLLNQARMRVQGAGERSAAANTFASAGTPADALWQSLHGQVLQRAHQLMHCGLMTSASMVRF